MKKENLKHDLSNSLTRIKIMIDLLDKKSFKEISKEDIIKDGEDEIQKLDLMFKQFASDIQ